MTDRITIVGLEAVGRHGVHGEEKRTGQLFRCDVTLHLDTRRAGTGDDLRETVDYGAVAESAQRVLAGPSRDLIETVAAEIAENVLDDDRVHAVEVTVHKPDAPIPVRFADVTVTVRRDRGDRLVATAPAAPASAVLGLGSNLGDRLAHLSTAVHEIDRLPGVEVLSVSPVVETDPVGGPVGQDRYLNAVAAVRTSLSPLRLLHGCQDVEQRHGRTRELRWGPRTLDVDVLTYGDLVVATAVLVLPHPRAAGRGFVLVPWDLLDPEAWIPATAGSVRVGDLLARLATADGRVPGVTVRHDIRIEAPVPASTSGSGP